MASLLISKNITVRLPTVGEKTPTLTTGMNDTAASLLLLLLAVAFGVRSFAKNKSSSHQNEKPSASHIKLCPFTPCAQTTQADTTKTLSLCPFAAKGKRMPNKHTSLKYLRVRSFRTLDPNDVRTSKSFWTLYQGISTEQYGLFGDYMGQSEVLPRAPQPKAIVTLAENEAAERYALGHADSYRSWLAAELSGKNLTEELKSLNRSETKLVLGACVYLRHSWHQGNPNVGPISDEVPVDARGNAVEEPPALKQAVEFVAERLDVAPYLTLYTWVFCNWKWTPASSAGSSGVTSDLPLTHKDMCDRSKGSLSPRFSWFTGAARESEANLWRAFAYSELVAIPLYGEVGKIMDEVTAFQSDTMADSPSSSSVERVHRSLQAIRDATKNITAALVSCVNFDLIDGKHFMQFMSTAHYAGTAAGASGFQSPAMVMLDAFLGIDFSKLPADMRESRSDNIAQMLPELVTIVFGVVRPGAKGLRKFLDRIACPDQRCAVKESFNGVADQIIMWRSRHRSRAGQYIKESPVTTGRSNEDMGGDVHSTFLTEMSNIITATKSVRLE